MPRPSRALGAALLLLAGAALAQLPSTVSGDYVFCDNSTVPPQLRVMSRQNPAQVRTLAVIPGGTPASWGMMDYDNRSYIVVAGGQVSRIALNGQVTPVFNAPAGSTVAAVSLHQDGASYVVAVNAGVNSGQLLQVRPPPQAPLLLAQFPAVITTFTLDVKSIGQTYLVALSVPFLGSTLQRAPRRPGTPAQPVGSVPFVVSGMAQDVDRPGSLYALTPGAPAGQIVRIDPNTGVFTPLPTTHPILAAARGISFLGESHPQSTAAGARLLAIISGSTAIPGTGLILVNPASGVLFTPVGTTSFQASALFPNRNREVTGAGSAQPGTGYQFRFAGPLSGGDDPFEPYYAACALDTSPGIFLPAPDTRKIPLAPDFFFFLSISGTLPAVFVNFTGTLDGNGVANPPPTINLASDPNFIGVRFYISYISINCSYPNCVNVIADPWSVVIGG